MRKTLRAFIRADGGDLPLEEADPATAEMITELRMSEEGQEGMMTFLERRKPAWQTPL